MYSVTFHHWHYGINCWTLDEKVLVYVFDSAAPCLIAYWRHGSWLDAISCPLCRQKVPYAWSHQSTVWTVSSEWAWTWNNMVLIFKVSVLCNLFNESRSDRQSKEVLGEITDYNKRYSGAPRRVSTLSNLIRKLFLKSFHSSFSLFPTLHLCLQCIRWCNFLLQPWM